MPETSAQMEAGRELDARVAETVFGWGDVTVDPEWTEAVGVRPDTGYAHLVPRYSTTWEGMRLVVEAMTGRGWCFTLDSPDPEMVGIWEGADLWDCTFSGWGDHLPTGQACAPTAPLAVCIAALRALADDG